MSISKSHLIDVIKKSLKKIREQPRNIEKFVLDEKNPSDVRN